MWHHITSLVCLPNYRLKLYSHLLRLRKKAQWWCVCCHNCEKNIMANAGKAISEKESHVKVLTWNICGIEHTPEEKTCLCTWRFTTIRDITWIWRCVWRKCNSNKFFFFLLDSFLIFLNDFCKLSLQLWNFWYMLCWINTFKSGFEESLLCNSSNF